MTYCHYYLQPYVHLFCSDRLAAEKLKFKIEAVEWLLLRLYIEFRLFILFYLKKSAAEKLKFI